MLYFLNGVRAWRSKTLLFLMVFCLAVSKTYRISGRRYPVFVDGRPCNLLLWSGCVAGHICAFRSCELSSLRRSTFNYHYHCCCDSTVQNMSCAYHRLRFYFECNLSPCVSLLTVIWPCHPVALS